MADKKPQPERHADKDCACDKCWKPTPEGEHQAAAYWRDLYARMGWPKDDLGYL
jgi:hypothetical protein